MEVLGFYKNSLRFANPPRPIYLYLYLFFIIFIRTLKPAFSTISLRLKIPDPSKNHQHVFPHLFRPVPKNRFVQYFFQNFLIFSYFLIFFMHFNAFWCILQISRIPVHSSTLFPFACIRIHLRAFWTSGFRYITVHFNAFVCIV